MPSHKPDMLFEPLTLPCGVILKNRIVKSAMSDSLGDGTGHPTPAQINLYRVWANGRLAVAIIGEVQCAPDYAEKPGNLVLNKASELERFEPLASAGRQNGAQLWVQLGHAGAMAYPPTSKPKGPSALDLPGLCCEAMSLDEISRLPQEFARTAALAEKTGFGGVQIHAAHGFLLSQLLSPLFNRRTDNYGGSIENRMRLVLEVISAVRASVGPEFPIAIKLNSSDQLEGGLMEDDALKVVAALERTSLDLIEISGGTYFPSAKSASDSGGSGPYFAGFTKRARELTGKPLMLTGGFKTLFQAEEAIIAGIADVVGLARALAIEPALPNLWQSGQLPEPAFPRFRETPEGGVTAWYTMQLTAIGEETANYAPSDLNSAIAAYAQRDEARTEIWLRHFGRPD